MPEGPPAPPRPGSARWLVPPAVAALAFLAFLPALGGGFLSWDDFENLLRTDGYRGLGWANLRWMLTATVMGHWIPLTWLSFGVNYALGGLEPWGYHLGNLLLHAASALLLYLVARRLLLAAGSGPADLVPWGAGLAALVFGVHPLRVESVAWVTERRDVLCGVFFLLAVLAYLRGVERAGAARRGWLGLSLLAFAGALLSKAVAMPLPAALLLLDVYPLGRHRREGWRRVLAEKIPYALLAAAAAAVALGVLRESHVVVTPYGTYGPGARVTMVAYSLMFYPRKLLFPADLSPMYELPPRVDPLEPRFLASAVALVMVSAALVLLRRRWPAGLAAWAYHALMLLPVAGVVHAGHQLAHDRYSYLSGLGFAVLAGGAVQALLAAGRRGRLGRPVVAAAAVAAAAVVLGWGASAWRQSRVWNDAETLWRWAADADPACSVCLHNLGVELIYGGTPTPERVREAEGLLRRSLALKPDRPIAYHNLGAALAMQRRHGEAAAAFLEYMRRAPAEAAGPARLGMLRADEGRWAEAVEWLRAALAMNPRFDEIRPDLARALGRRAEEVERRGEAAEAAALRREAEQALDPAWAPAQARGLVPAARRQPGS